MVDGSLDHGVAVFFSAGEDFGIDQGPVALHFELIEDFAAI